MVTLMTLVVTAGIFVGARKAVGAGREDRLALGLGTLSFTILLLSAAFIVISYKFPHLAPQSPFWSNFLEVLPWLMPSIFLLMLSCALAGLYAGFAALERRAGPLKGALGPWACRGKCGHTPRPYSGPHLPASQTVKSIYF